MQGRVQNIPSDLLALSISDQDWVMSELEQQGLDISAIKQDLEFLRADIIGYASEYHSDVLYNILVDFPPQVVFYLLNPYATSLSQKGGRLALFYMEVQAINYVPLEQAGKKMVMVTGWASKQVKRDLWFALSDRSGTYD